MPRISPEYFSPRDSQAQVFAQRLSCTGKGINSNGSSSLNWIISLVLHLPERIERLNTTDRDKTSTNLGTIRLPCPSFYRWAFQPHERRWSVYYRLLDPPQATWVIIALCIALDKNIRSANFSDTGDAGR